MTKVSKVYIGAKFGRLTVAAVTKKRRLYALCYCACGGVSLVNAYGLGLTTNSCGCIHKEAVSKVFTTHGQTGTPEYRAWKAMWGRCTNPNDGAYYLYCDRTPVERWKSFENFYADIGKRPSPQHSLERLSNEKPYSPDNCVWASKQEQNRNRSSSRRYTDGREVLCLIDLAERLGIKYSTLHSRLGKLNWPIEKALGPGWKPTSTGNANV